VSPDDPINAAESETGAVILLGRIERFKTACAYLLAHADSVIRYGEHQPDALHLAAKDAARGSRRLH
jgi:hypothetical protein